MPSNKGEMARSYDASLVERRIYAEWVDSGYFSPVIDQSKSPFCIIMPPPNVTGELHLGHALTTAIEDALTRWHRMLGDSTLWLPGTDHAGIATQWVVERLLAEEGTSRQVLGRDAFLERVWSWVGQYGNTINEQLKRLGASCDWSRSTFTLDDGPALAVRTTFANLYDKGLIYRHERIINWCPRCSTALSDLEVEYEDEEGTLFYIRYPLDDDSGATIVVATTRPESMLGDTGVAVHPEDERYLSVVGRNIKLPLVDRTIPVVSDTSIEIEFGTGALKVTPGHDPVDFDIGERHSLPIITVIGFDGCMNHEAGVYEGLDRFDCREKVVEDLESLGLLDKTEPLHHSVGHCQRCDSVVEPLISLQWFLKVGDYEDSTSIAGRAYQAVLGGDIKIVPDRFSRVYLNWLENIRDWCISRQLWWGHRIPVWYCDKCLDPIVSIDDIDMCPECGSPNIRQDEDVLDTWFSSGLWPHSTLGWPTETEDLRGFYPGAVMETGYDILFFWVARMIMMGIENTGDIPFRTVFLHGLVRDADGAKMSKTRGNTLDPLDLIDQYGTDALRFALTTGTAPGNDLRLTDGKLESSRNFANKLWNASRYVLSNINERHDLDCWYDLKEIEHIEDRWILSRLDTVIDDVNRSLANFELGEGQQRLYDFVWNDYCDWYIEMAKIRLRSDSEPSPIKVLVYVLDTVLRLLHPFMPFITEEIWQTLGEVVTHPQGTPKSIMVAAYPESNGEYLDAYAERDVSLVMQTIRAIRNIRSQLQIAPSNRLRAIIEANGMSDVLSIESPVIESLSRVDPLEIVEEPTGDSTKSITLVVNPLVIRIPLEGVVDLTYEEERLTKELNEALGNKARVEKLVSNPNFVAKARPEVVESEKERLQTISDQIDRLQEIISQISG
ncbi:MAG: valine--tRNA ligase [Dehalococcoidia bacterium]|nr:valine--tRNA ligase [Dehalococcoidia bacterium]